MGFILFTIPGRDTAFVENYWFCEVITQGEGILLNYQFARIWQRMTTNDNEWQRVTTSDKEWYNEWQQMTANGNEWEGVTTSGTSDKEWQRVIQRVTTSGNKWQWVKASDSSGTTNENGTAHFKEWMIAILSMAKTDTLLLQVIDGFN